MKLYWCRRSIPELANLPRKVRNKNYRDAFRMARTHREFWIGTALYFVLLLGAFELFDSLFPGESGIEREIFRCVICVVPCVQLWTQFNVYIMRKYYRHILLRCTQE